MSLEPENRTGSADSAGSEGTGSDDFVQVGPEDALAAEQQEEREPELVSGSGMADFGSDEYMYGDGGEEEEEGEDEGEESEGEGEDDGGAAGDSKPSGQLEEVSQSARAGLY